jgi:hypothetical protein
MQLRPNSFLLTPLTFVGDGKGTDLELLLATETFNFNLQLSFFIIRTFETEEKM